MSRALEIETTTLASADTLRVPPKHFIQVIDILQLIAQFCDTASLISLQATNSTCKEAVSESLTYEEPDKKLAPAIPIIHSMIRSMIQSLPPQVSFQLLSATQSFQSKNITATGFILNLLKLLENRSEDASSVQIGVIKALIKPRLVCPNLLSAWQTDIMQSTPVTLDTTLLLKEEEYEEEPEERLHDLLPRGEILQRVAERSDIFRCDDMSFRDYAIYLENNAKDINSTRAIYTTPSFLISTIALTTLVASGMFLMIKYKDMYPTQVGLDCYTSTSNYSTDDTPTLVCQTYVPCRGGSNNITNVTAAMMAVCNMLCWTGKNGNRWINVPNTTAAGICPELSLQLIGAFATTIGGIFLLILMHTTIQKLWNDHQHNKQLMNKWLPADLLTNGDRPSAGVTAEKERTSLTNEVGKCLRCCVNGVFGFFAKSPREATETTPLAALAAPFVVNVNERNERNEGANFA